MLESAAAAGLLSEVGGDAPVLPVAISGGVGTRSPAELRLRAASLLGRLALRPPLRRLRQRTLGRRRELAGLGSSRIAVHVRSSILADARRHGLIRRLARPMAYCPGPHHIA